MKHCMDIKNDVQRNATAMRLAGASNKQISKVVGELIDNRGPIGTGKYSCECNNYGPRWIENSRDLICPGCWQWALDHHQEMAVNGVKPVTMDMIEKSTWGFNVEKIRELNDRKHVHRVINDHLAAGNDPEDCAGVDWDQFNDWTVTEVK